MSKGEAHRHAPQTNTLDRTWTACYLKMARNARHAIAQQQGDYYGNQYGTYAEEACRTPWKRKE
jgi:hypothetical protein